MLFILSANGTPETRPISFTTIMHADKIVEMRDGRIVEVGTHAELMENRSVYDNLYKAQFEHALSMDTGLMEEVHEEQDRWNRV